MQSRRHVLRITAGAGVTAFLAACGGPSQTAPAATPATTGVNATTVPAGNAAAGGSITFVLENDVIDFDPASESDDDILF